MDELVKNNYKPTTSTPSSTQSPTTYSHIYLRVQPFITSFTLPDQPSTDEASSSKPSTQSHLQFLLYLSDPAHQLVHTTITQAIPGQWLEIWDQYDWVEDLVAEALRVGVEVIGQEYVVARMGWGNKDTEGQGSQNVEGKQEENVNQAES